jgi:tRNA threonylcarbamoyl adenosine modification protein YjeE
MTIPIPLPALAATEQLARKIAPLLRSGDMLALAGPLGAGKTSFARMLLRALDIKDEVPSPTFTLVQSYETQKFPVHHFDLYRLKNPGELDELGWDDMQADGVTLVEWPERAAGRMPTDFLMLRFAMNEKGERQCVIESHGLWAQRLKGTPL